MASSKSMATPFGFARDAALAAIAWEVLHRTYAGGIGVVLTRAPWVVRDGAKASRQALLDDGGWYACALTHACIVGARGVMHTWQMLDAPLSVKFSIPKNEEDAFHGAAAAVETTNLFFLSWLIYDVLHLLYRHTQGQRDVPMLAHHVGFISSSLICGAHNALPFPFGWLISGEISSIFLKTVRTLS